ncbi:unnamed protein product [Ectocarpus sp. 12 AP-2014]
MVEMGLVPSEVATEAGYPELAEEERALTQQAEKRDAAAGAEGSSRVFGSAGDGWRSRVPSSDLKIDLSSWKSQSAESSIDEEQLARRIDTPRGASKSGGDGSGTSEGFPAKDTETPRDGGSSSAGGRGQTRYGGRVSDHMDVDGDKSNGVKHGARGSGRGLGSGGSGGSGHFHVRRPPSSSGSNDGGAGGGGGGRPARQEKQEDAPPATKVSAAGGGGDREKVTLGKKDPLRKENRMWNLKHMRATQEGKMDVCAYCRLHPDGGLMVCSSHELAKMHSFCFPCLKRKDGIEKSDLVGGGIKWECPTCRERRSRPKRGAGPPSSLRGTTWAGGGGLTSQGAVSQQGNGQQASVAGGRSREPEGGAAGSGGGHAGIKRSSSSAELSASAAAAAQESGARRQSASPPASRGAASSGSARGGGGSREGDAFGFRRDASPRGGGSSSSGGGGGGGGGGTSRGTVDNGGGVSGGNISRRTGAGDSRLDVETEPQQQEQEDLTGQLPIERRRLLRMVATLALDRLQQLDPLNLFKDPVPDGVEGYAEAIEHPIDFSTIRRRSQWELYGSIHELALDVQLLCANARTFNGPGTIYHKEATNVLMGAERIWPQAQALLDRLTSAETKASRHNIIGPAASSDAWPLDGPFAGFELTPANEDAYYMHVAIRRASAAARARAEQETKEDKEEGSSAASSGGGKKKRRSEGELAARRGRVEAAVEVAVAVASSPALLYTRGEMGEEESALRESLSLYRTDCTDKALRRPVGSAKCEPIDLPTLHKRRAYTLPMPTPVIRQFAAPDGEFLAQSPEDQPVPSGPNPSLGEEIKGEAPKAVVPEWKVLQAAHGARERSGEEAGRHLRAFRGFLKEIAVVSRTRLRLGKSTVQGFGVFATQAIGAHELVAEFVGERVKLDEAKKRVEVYRRTNTQERVVRLGEDGMFIDATRKGNLARFLNHSCDPNVYMLAVTAGKGESQEKRVCFFSLRKIPADEELLYSYPAPHTVGLGGAAVAMVCACRAPGCRGRQSKKEDQL